MSLQCLPLGFYIICPHTATVMRGRVSKVNYNFQAPFITLTKTSTVICTQAANFPSNSPSASLSAVSFVSLQCLRLESHQRYVCQTTTTPNDVLRSVFCLFDLLVWDFGNSFLAVQHASQGMGLHTFSWS